MPNAALNRKADYTSIFDVTGAVCVSDPYSVQEEIERLFAVARLPIATEMVRIGFAYFAQVMSGRDSDFLPLDTPYHDIQHSLDVTLCTARLVIAHENAKPTTQRLGAQRRSLAVLCALFHDTGYLRRSSEPHITHGALLIREHVSRSAHLIELLLCRIGLSRLVPAAMSMVHCTGYERQLSQLSFRNDLDRTAGHLVGTADLIAQMADPFYPAKVHDRLFVELEIAGMAGAEAALQGRGPATAEALLEGTPEFIEQAFCRRLDKAFNRAYNWLDVDACGQSPYLHSIERNMQSIKSLRGRPSARDQIASPPVMSCSIIPGA